MTTIIPKVIQLGGIKITVEIDPTLFKNRRILGDAQYPPQKIVLDPTVLDLDLAEQNYVHELVHWILYVMNEDDLRNNERFVDLFATFLHQALKSGDQKYLQEEVTRRA